MLGGFEDASPDAQSPSTQLPVLKPGADKDADDAPAESPSKIKTREVIEGLVRHSLTSAPASHPKAPEHSHPCMKAQCVPVPCRPNA